LFSSEFLIHRLKAYEAKKYELLIVYLGKTSNYNIIKDFFWHFNDPKYVFHLLQNVYKVKWVRNSISIFEDSILHFWSVSRDATEKYILKMFDPKFKFGLLPVEVIMCGYGSPLQINLLELKTKNEQEKAIDCFCLYPHSFDRLLPILLELRKSKFRAVKQKLESRLGLLIIESYHGLLYDAVSNLLSKSKADKMFLERLKKPLNLYENIKNLKNKVNDLNPFMNEKDLFNYYIELEKEIHSKMMNEMGKSSFLREITKNTIIVRGNSWKFPNKEVMPLAHIKSEHWIDKRAYLNPDLFELTLNNFDKI